MAGVSSMIKTQSYAPAADFDLCLDLNRFSFVITAEKNGESHELKMKGI